MSDLRILALDGGGVQSLFKGMFTLVMLKQLMETIDPSCPPKPCEYFDMIGGTSSGGLIAIMLGRLKMTIDESIHAYLSLSKRILQTRKKSVRVNGKLQDRFDSEELVRAMKEMVKAQGLQEDELLKNDSTDTDTCKVFVCATSKETSETMCFTSYRSPRSFNDFLNTVKIWEACRATSAAFPFFDPIAIGRYEEEFFDGGYRANNPIFEVWGQAQLIWGSARLETRIKCIISIGTGVSSITPYQNDVLYISEALNSIATETEQTAEKFRRDKLNLDENGQYHRLNVHRGLEEFQIESKELVAVIQHLIESQGILKQMQICADNQSWVLV
ncbi:hypothetical protein B7494_g5770 [Chlorociboria aeruginascens]|nr:hypothetical protein B7494_g5770 [Chlorociboria aeruginascens]